MTPRWRRWGDRARDGGVPARRAVIRWGLRLFRREWRQQLLVLTLLTVAVTAAIVGASAGYHLGALGHTARFGTANQMFTFDAVDPHALDASVAAVAERFDTIDVITRRHVAVPGSADIIEFRAQDPQGAYGAAMLALLRGRHPAAAGEVAVTDAVARTFDLTVGSGFTLDGREWRVVGLVENPDDLRDEFALVAPAHAPAPETVSVLIDSPDQIDIPLPSDGAFDWSMADQGADAQQMLAAVTALGAAAVAMILVALVAAAGFVVIAQRRQRQLGMLAAIGASRRHLRLVLVTNGAAIGAVAAVIGTAVALTVWIMAAPYVETAVGARIDRFDLLPWWLVAITMLMAVTAATLAAWWPARTVARMPVTVALSGRPPRPRPVRRSTVMAGALIVGGVICLIAADRSSTVLVGTGTVATILGILAVTPLALRTLAVTAGRLPVAVRLAMRDLARYQARSGAALAAISLALGIAAAIIITTTTAERTADIGNLSPGQMLITVDGSRIRELVTRRTPAEFERLRAQIDQLAAPLDDPTVLDLQMAIDPAEEPRPGRGEHTWQHAVEVGDGERTANPGPLFVATPQLLDLYGIDPDEIAPGTDVLTVRDGDIGLRLGIVEQPVADVERLDVPGYASAPTSLITPEGLRRRGWEPAIVGWLVDAGRPLTSTQIAQAREVAARADLMAETRDGINLAEIRALRSGSMAAGTVVALAVLAMAIGLIRNETAGELRTLTATGATSTIRRTLTAATASGLALLGVVVGTIGAYIVMAAGFVTDLGTLLPIPVRHLLVIVLGVPVAAATAGWLLGGRQPPSLVLRQPRE